MDKLYLLVRLVGELVAIEADVVGSVIEMDAVTPVPRVPRHVAGLFALRSNVLTVICTREALGVGRYDPEGVKEAVVVTVDGHSYALLVDSVEDVAVGGAVTPNVALLSGGWRRAVIGQLACERGNLLLIDPVRLIPSVGDLAA